MAYTDLTGAVPGIGAVTNLTSGIMGSIAANDAARAQIQGQQQALGVQQNAMNTAIAGYNPWTTTGTAAAGTYADKVNNLQQPGFNYNLPDFKYDVHTDPGAQAQIAASIRANNASAAGGGIANGAAARALNTDVQNTAQGSYQNARTNWQNEATLRNGLETQKYSRNMDFINNILDRLKGISDTGLNAIGSQNQQRSGYTSNISNLLTGIGQSKAAGILGANKALTTGITGAAGNVGQLIGGL